MILKFHVKRDQMRVTEEHGQIGSNGVVVVGKHGNEGNGWGQRYFLPNYPTPISPIRRLGRGDLPPYSHLT